MCIWLFLQNFFHFMGWENCYARKCRWIWFDEISFFRNIKLFYIPIVTVICSALEYFEKKKSNLKILMMLISLERFLLLLLNVRRSCRGLLCCICCTCRRYTSDPDSKPDFDDLQIKLDVTKIAVYKYLNNHNKRFCWRMLQYHR